MAEALESGKGIGPLMQGLGRERAQPSLTHRLWAKLMTRYSNDPHALVGVIRGTPALALTADELAAIEIPILSVVGERDPMLVSARAMVDMSRNPRLVVVRGADHVETPMRSERFGMLRTQSSHCSGPCESFISVAGTPDATRVRLWPVPSTSSTSSSSTLGDSTSCYLSPTGNFRTMSATRWLGLWRPTR